MDINQTDNTGFQNVYPYENDECKVGNRDEVIDNYLRNELTEQEVLAFDEHTFHCEVCFEELRFREEAVELLKQQESPRKRRAAIIIRLFKPEEVKQWGKFAAAAAIVFIALAIWNQVKTADQEKIFYANSLVSERLELLVDLRGRDRITMIAPGKEVYIKNRYFGCAQQDLLFRWTRDDSAELDLVILSNTERKLFTFSTTENQIVFDNVTGKLQPGLYYWKLQDNGLQAAGRIFVNKPD